MNSSDPRCAHLPRWTCRDDERNPIHPGAYGYDRAKDLHGTGLRSMNKVEEPEAVYDPTSLEGRILLAVGASATPIRHKQIVAAIKMRPISNHLLAETLLTLRQSGDLVKLGHIQTATYQLGRKNRVFRVTALTSRDRVA